MHGADASPLSLDAHERRLVRAFADRTLPRSDWTHTAHLEVCWFAVRTLGAEVALDHLRASIRAYNVATGTANTDTGGYHETLTRYYVGAVTHVAGRPGTTVADALADPICRRDAPLRHWHTAELMSVPARRAWVAPTLAPLPWDR